MAAVPLVDVRPQFRSEDWAAYQDVNDAVRRGHRRGAARSPDTPVFIQDYHLALVAPALRARRPAARTALFWHIPWPYPGSAAHLSVARASILDGLLANDLLAFQLERDRRNFLLAVEEELGAEVELEASRVRFGGRATHRRRPCRSAWTTIASRASPPIRRSPHEQQRLRERSACAPRSSGSASTGSTTPRAFRSGSTRSTR